MQKNIVGVLFFSLLIHIALGVVLYFFAPASPPHSLHAVSETPSIVILKPELLINKKNTPPQNRISNPSKVVIPQQNSSHSLPSYHQATPNPSSLNQAALNDYFNQILKQIEQHAFYPPQARAQKKQGQALVQIEIAPSGELKQSSIHESSGSTQLDQAALQIVSLASPYPPQPDPPARTDAPNQTLKLVVPISFEIK